MNEYLQLDLPIENIKIFWCDDSLFFEADREDGLLVACVIHNPLPHLNTKIEKFALAGVTYTTTSMQLVALRDSIEYLIARSECCLQGG